MGGGGEGRGGVKEVGGVMGGEWEGLGEVDCGCLEHKNVLR